MSREGDFELVTLRNGARAVRHVGYDEVMHPSVGPWAEANRLYVEQPDLMGRLVRPGPERTLRILDVGLGAAANAIAAINCAGVLLGKHRPVEIISHEIDLAPLRLALGDLEGFPYLRPWRDAATSLIDSGRWERPGLVWRLELGDFVTRFTATDLELVYFDPFSPGSNPALWTRPVLSRIRAACSDDAHLMTYSAATPTRVALLLAGFFVGAGVSIGTKSETTIAATRRESLEKPLGERWLARWKRSDHRAPHGEPFTPEIERAVLAHPQWRE